MEEDPIVAEVRRVREEHAAQFGCDLRAIVQDLQERQRSSGRTYVQSPPRRPATAAAVMPETESVHKVPTDGE